MDAGKHVVNPAAPKETKLGASKREKVRQDKKKKKLCRVWLSVCQPCVKCEPRQQEENFIYKVGHHKLIQNFQLVCTYKSESFMQRE